MNELLEERAIRSLRTKNTNDAPDVAKNKRKRQQQFEYFDAYQETVSAVANICSLAPTVAVQIDPESHVMRFSYTCVEFLHDVATATAFALEGHPELQAAHRAIQNGEPVDAKTTAKIMTRIGRILKARHLRPREYFSPVHPKHRSGRNGK
jgi:hypothetical protein